MQQRPDSVSTAGESPPVLPTNPTSSPGLQSSSSIVLDKPEEKSVPSSSGLGGLSSLSTLSGLLNTASTFKPRRDEGSGGGQRGVRGDMGGGRGRPGGQFDSGRFDDFSKSFSSGGGGQGGGRTAWKDERDGGRVKGDGMTRSFGPRAHNMMASPDSDPVQSRLPSSGGRSSASTPGTTIVSPQGESPFPATAKADLAEDVTATSGVVSTSSNAPAAAKRGLETSETNQADAAEAASRSVEPKPEPWRPRRHIDPSEQFRRDVNGLLNKLTVENFPVIAEKLAKVSEEVKTKKDLETIVEFVLDKTFGEPNFSELYADLCLVLSYRCPTNLDNAPAGKQSLFSALLIQKWREAFDKMPPSVELSEEQKAELSPEDQEILITKMKTRVQGMCISLAEFVIRRMVGMGGFSRAASVLLTREAPEEHYIEGICQMLSTAGAFLDSDPQGKSGIEACFGRLQELQAREVCSKRLTCLIQDLVDARKVGWHKKIHKEKAKGLSALKEEVENADLVGGSVVTAQYGTVVKLGQRSNLENASYANYLNEQEKRSKTKQQQ